MPNSSDTETPAAEDRYNLNRFLSAQENTYERSLLEIRSGQKRTHWMWYIFPQFEGLSLSLRSQHYAIKSVEEARSYLSHPLLGPRLLESIEEVLRVEERTAQEIFGETDAQKLRSCATLFALVSPTGSVFERLLGKHYASEQDIQTLELLHLDTP
ncbi:hypothetical protein IAD21_06288 [Abditibacteriota bacterium]|nr:hypothetical protein IAD21_06288 [Abditibacteriota bacterium]